MEQFNIERDEWLDMLNEIEMNTKEESPVI